MSYHSNPFKPPIIYPCWIPCTERVKEFERWLPLRPLQVMAPNPGKPKYLSQTPHTFYIALCACPAHLHFKRRYKFNNHHVYSLSLLKLLAPSLLETCARKQVNVTGSI